jgi:hypothetical protein
MDELDTRSGSLMQNLSDETSHRHSVVRPQFRCGWMFQPARERAAPVALGRLPFRSLRMFSAGHHLRETRGIKSRYRRPGQGVNTAHSSEYWRAEQMMGVCGKRET